MLLKSKLINSIRKITDAKYSNWDGFPDSIDAAAQRWADAIKDYAGDVTPASLSVTAASETFKNIMLSLLMGKSTDPFTAPFTVFASILGVGMSPAFVAVPPVSPIVLKSVFDSGVNGESAENCAKSFADIVDIWFKTGTATPATGGPPTPWN